MNPAHFLNIYLVEVEKLFKRPTAMAGLALSVFFGLLGAFFGWGYNRWLVTPGQVQYDDLIKMAEAGELTGQEALAIYSQARPEFADVFSTVSQAFVYRSMLFVPILIFLLGGMIFATEFSNRTVREAVLRPVPRPAIVLAKWLALTTWVVAAASATFGTSVLPAVLLMPAPSEWFPTLLQFGTAMLTDLGMATIALCVAVLTRSVAATVASLVMLFVAQFGVWVGLSILSQDEGRNVITHMLSLPEWLTEPLWWGIDIIYPWQPPFVIGTSPCSAVEFTMHWQGYASLVGIIVGCLAIAIVSFQRMDVP